ncbi:hypothetical protein CEXT_681521 [Caerostris extrusa]|uniref:Uncharacterized protein n=1 Tax=Caerostris extrusa TaxID=172846 RepID=A0AAV4QGP6_CAEEX|nr:hypothetical protein CEXT_681521 [Caerostris extrusa]
MQLIHSQVGFARQANRWPISFLMDACLHALTLDKEAISDLAQLIKVAYGWTVITARRNKVDDEAHFVIISFFINVLIFFFFCSRDISVVQCFRIGWLFMAFLYGG